MSNRRRNGHQNGRGGIQKPQAQTARVRVEESQPVAEQKLLHIVEPRVELEAKDREIEQLNLRIKSMVAQEAALLRAEAELRTVYQNTIESLQMKIDEQKTVIRDRDAYIASQDIYIQRQSEIINNPAFKWERSHWSPHSEGLALASQSPSALAQPSPEPKPRARVPIVSGTGTRKFDSKNFAGGFANLQPSNVTVSEHGHRHFSYNGQHTMLDMLVVSVDGACPNNGKRNTIKQASLGVYFGPDSSWNISGLVPPEYKQTNQVAELYAAFQAMVSLDSLFKESEDTMLKTKTVIVITDSTYVADGMCKHIWKRLRDGANYVQNYSLLSRLHQKILELEATGVEVKIWDVDRAENKEADRLANQVFGRSV